jgi:hypothetical protein
MASNGKDDALTPSVRSAGPAAHERRAFRRYAVDLPIDIRLSGQVLPCRLVDISAGGALVRTERRVEVGDKIAIDLPSEGTVIGTVVRLTPSHIAVSFPGLVVVSKFLPERPV